ncbi:hypothetical protein ACFSC6_20045 [Rufibacter sediminis]|uniref:Uncharacterized protein n=1 Tax=Rufibacter sediminis TaxID=2762756 RepID=A0ABR6VNH9_9BACT|nr:hypothetical protein [Rufibacter sediminis]MBC3538742.1 hypothetical protein [Rufibacter sediminis]
MQYIDNCITLINSSFPQSFFQPNQLSTGQQGELLFLQNLKLKVDTLAFSVYEALHFTIITGDYINFNVAKTKLLELQQAVGSVGPVVEQGLLTAAGNLGQTLYNERLSHSFSYSFSGIINDSITLFRHLIQQIESELTNPELTSLFRTHQLDGGRESAVAQVTVALIGIEFETKVHYERLKLNLRIAAIDHKLIVAREPLSELLQIKEALGLPQATDPSYLLLLRDKCNFLLYKILKRLEEDDQRYFYTHDLQDKEVKKENLSINFYSSFKQLTDSHYQENERPNLVQKQRFQNFEPLFRNNALNLFSGFHTLIKYKKDFHPDLNKLDEVTKKFDLLVEQTIANQTHTHLFDSRASLISQNYAHNNCFSLCLQTCDIDSIKSRLKAIEELQDTTEVHNYFPFFYYASFLENKIKEAIPLAESKQDLNKIHQTIRLLGETLKKCFISYEWCKDRTLLAFQLPFNECIKPIIVQGTTINIFLSSSFILPLNYNTILLERDRLEREYLRLQTLYEVKQEIVQEKNEIKKQKEDLQNFINSHDRKQVEILSIFAAFVFFTAGSIKVFEKAVLFSEVVLFMLATAYSLGLFVILIWLITRNYSIPITWVHFVLIGCFLVFTLFLISYLMHVPWIHGIITFFDFTRQS